MELTPSWFMGKLFLHDLHVQTLFSVLASCFCNEMLFCLIALLSASQPLLSFTFFTYVLASTAHLYMPQLFTHCLPTIICYIDVYCVCTIKQLFYTFLKIVFSTLHVLFL